MFWRCFGHVSKGITCGLVYAPPEWQCFDQAIYDIGTEILCLQCSGHEPIKNRTPENGRHTYRYLRVKSFLNPVSKRNLKPSGTFVSENLHATLDSQVTFFMDVYPGGRLRHET